MQCPKCKTDTLKATKFEQDLLGFECKSCKGTLISLMNYREWVERSQDNAMGGRVTAIITEIPDTRNALLCPKCGKVMVKYRISGYTNSFLDTCSACDFTWLDKGEWQLLKSLRLSSTMPKVFTESWQRRVRKDISERSRKQRMRSLVGDQDFAKVEELRTWLQHNPHKAQIIFYINHE